jgi:hypothetical protein
MQTKNVIAIFYGLPAAAAAVTLAYTRNTNLKFGALQKRLQYSKLLGPGKRGAPFTSAKLGSELSVGPKIGGNVSMIGLYLGSKKEAIRLLEPMCLTIRRFSVTEFTSKELFLDYTARC